MAGTVLLATACSQEAVISENEEQEYAPVTVRVNEFSMSLDEFSDTRAEQTAEAYTGVKAITLAFYGNNNAEVYNTTQLRGDGTYTTFGEFTCNLPIGTYTMVVIGRGHSEGDEFTLTSPVLAQYTSEKARETFCATQTVTVTSTTPLTLTPTVNRVISKLEIISTDGRSAGATTVRAAFGAGGKSFSPTSGLATADDGFSISVQPSTAVGNPINVAGYLFLASDEEDMDITIQVFDAVGTSLFTKVIEDVPFKRNRVTRLTGPVFSASASSAAFTFETAWLEDKVINF